MLTFKFDFLRSLVKHLLLIINKLFYKMNWKKRKRNVIKVILIIEKISILVSMMSKKIFFAKFYFFWNCRMEGAGDDIPDGWTAKVSRSSGQAYYVNRFTNESQWEKPTKPAQKPSSEKVQVCLLLMLRNEWWKKIVE